MEIFDGILGLLEKSVLIGFIVLFWWVFYWIEWKRTRDVYDENKQKLDDELRSRILYPNGHIFHEDY